MRVLGFSLEWEKLKETQFTTFRFRRKDKDWEVGEVVRVVLHPRHPNHRVLGIAQIIGKEPRWVAHRAPSGIPLVTSREAREDGFAGSASMVDWFGRRHGSIVNREPMNKLILRWKETTDGQGGL